MLLIGRCLREEGTALWCAVLFPDPRSRDVKVGCSKSGLGENCRMH